ncbi:MAG: hypothetical protein ABS75_26585 [Pelagibacterium sp. SCN 63-23]|nr:MAG: hypothetical protein ABS75_26585 [Pelagibacterium sp. SCN 63-23]
MTSLELNDYRLSVYDLMLNASPKTIAAAGAGFVYVASGQAELDGARVAADDGALVRGAFSLGGSGHAWLYEFAPVSQPVLNEDGISLVISHRLPSAFSGERILRADRVESNPGAATPLHGHRGPGIRRLLKGQLRAYIGENIERIDTGTAWFETGTDWVIGKNIHDSASAFVRVMILPAELAGGTSSFVAANAEEASKPRSVTYRLFGEQAV